MLSNNKFRTGVYSLSFLFGSYLEYTLRIPFIFFISSFFLFLLIDLLDEQKTPVSIGVIIITFILFNMISTSWLYHSSYANKAFLIFIANGCLMSCPILIWYFGKKYLKFKLYYFIFIWLSFEYIHFEWRISWPWLCFGHVFGKQCAVVQWYEYTGVLGGSLWILLVGYFLFETFTKKSFFYIKVVAVTFFTPIFISFLTEKHISEDDSYIKVRVIQTDFHNDTTQYRSNLDRIKKFIKSQNGLDSYIDYILLPEYFLNQEINLDKIQTSTEIKVLSSFLAKSFPKNTKIILGLELFNKDRITGKNHKYNAIIELDEYGVNNIYCKRHYIPFHEVTPKGFEFLNIESANYSYAKNLNKRFYNKTKNVTPVLTICYESIYGKHFIEQESEYPQVFFMFASESFFNHSIGIDQYLDIVKLRAIEFRKSIAKSSHLGYSVFISKYGELKKICTKKIFDTLTDKIGINSEKTIYAEYGNYLGILSIISFCLLSLITIFNRIR